MSKERLEEIVEKISEQTFDRIIVPQTKITVEYQDIKFLINAITKQDERVHELSAVVSCVASREVEIVEQNKRYREVLEKVRQNMIGHYGLGGERDTYVRWSKELIDSTLEGEE